MKGTPEYQYPEKVATRAEASIWRFSSASPRYDEAHLHPILSGTELHPVYDCGDERVDESASRQVARAEQTHW